MRYDLPANEICPLNLNSNERRLRNSDLSMTYAIAGFGIFMALLVFIIEVCIDFCVKVSNYENIYKKTLQISGHRSKLETHLLFSFGGQIFQS